MKFIEYLEEEYVDTIDSCVVLKWPTKKELTKDIKSGTARFMYIGNTLYAFDAAKTVHYKVANYCLHKEYSDMLFWGMGPVKEGKIFIDIRKSKEIWDSEFNVRTTALKQAMKSFKLCKNYFYNFDDIYKYIIDRYKLKESFYTSFTMPNRAYVEVFYDPDNKEIQSLKNTVVRFMILNGKLYIWDGDLATHWRVAQEMKVPYHDLDLSGIAKVVSGKLKYDSGYDLTFFGRRTVLDRLDKFKDYFTNFSIMRRDLVEIIGD
jgi:hypothetical protein